MKISFHGGAQTVTGSKHLLHLDGGKKVLLDCGMFQGMGHETDALNRDFGFEPSEVTALVLSHAHIDHSGLIPKLVKDGFNGPIFCTPATKELVRELLDDSAGIQESEVERANKRRIARGEPLIEPLYTKEDAVQSFSMLQAVDYGEWFDVVDGVQAMYTDAGHIIGSAAVHLRIAEGAKTRTLTFSGDLGRYRDVILRSPESFPQADYILIESTYGDTLHEEVRTSVDTLLQWIERVCVQRRGKLIIPAFSLGRTQEILYALNQLSIENRLPKLDYFLDSPLSITVTDIVKRFPQYFNHTIQQVLQRDEDPFHFEGLQYIESVQDSKGLNYRNEPCVIISASGMAEAGRVKHHIANNIENSRNGILMTGYCEPNSLGGRLLKNPEEVTIFGTLHQVNAEVGAIKSMSAHGDYEDMCQWLADQDKEAVQKIFLVHGEPGVQEAFKQRLLRKGYRDVEIPARHEVVGLG